MDKIQRIKKCAEELHKLFVYRGHASNNAKLFNNKMFYYGSAVQSLCFSYGYVNFKNNDEKIKRIVKNKNVKEIDKLNRYLLEIILPTLNKWEVNAIYLYIGSNNQHISYVINEQGIKVYNNTIQ